MDILLVGFKKGVKLQKGPKIGSLMQKKFFREEIEII